MTYTLGVDLGTTTSAAAVLRDRHLEPCPLGESSLTVPSIVLPRDDGRTLIGEAAALHGGVAPVRLARAPGAPGGSADFPALGDPHQAMCMLLDAVVDQVASDRGGRPARLALVQPAAQAQGPVGPYDRVAAETQGDPMLVAAPVATAAIVNHEWGLTAGSTIGVLDLGGDVSEAALVRRTGDGFDIVGRPCSGPGVGGSEIDGVVLRHIDSALDHALSTLGPDADMAALDRLLAGCRRAKEQLLHTEDAIVEVGLPRMTARVRLTRAELQRLVRPHLAEAVAALERTIAETGLSADDLEAVVLIGGSARLPAAAELVAERMGRPVVVEAAPEMTAALGAALVGTPAAERPDPLPATSLPLEAMVDAIPAGGTVTFPATPAAHAAHAAWAAGDGSDGMEDGEAGERADVDEGGQRRRRFIDRSVARWRPGDGQPAHRAPAPRHRGRWPAARRPAGPEGQGRQGRQGTELRSDSGNQHEAQTAGPDATSQNAADYTGNGHHGEVGGPGVADRDTAPDNRDHHDGWTAGLAATGQDPTPNTGNQAAPGIAARDTTPDTGNQHDGWAAGLGATGQDATPNTDDRHDDRAAALGATRQNTTDPTPGNPRDNQAAGLGATGQTPTPDTSDEHENQATPAIARRNTTPDTSDQHDGWAAGLRDTGHLPTPDTSNQHDDQTTPAVARRDATPNHGNRHDDPATPGIARRDATPDNGNRHDDPDAPGIARRDATPDNGNRHDDPDAPGIARREAAPDNGDPHDGWAAGLRNTGQIPTLDNGDRRDRPSAPGVAGWEAAPDDGDRHDGPADGVVGTGRHRSPWATNRIRRTGRTVTPDGLDGASRGSRLDDGGRHGRLGGRMGRLGGRRGGRDGRAGHGRDGRHGGDHGSGDGTGEVRMHGDDRGNRRVVAASLTLLVMMAVGGALLATGAAHRGSDERPVDAVETSELPNGGETPGESDPARPTSIGSASSGDRPDSDDPSSSSTTAGRDRTAGDRNSSRTATAGPGAGSTTTATDLDGDGRPDGRGDGHRDGSPDTTAPPTPTDPPITAPERPDAPPTTAPPPAPQPQPQPNLVENLFGILLGGQ